MNCCWPAKSTSYYCYVLHSLLSFFNEVQPMLMDDERLPIVNAIISPVSLRGHGIALHNASLIRLISHTSLWTSCVQLDMMLTFLCLNSFYYLCSWNMWHSTKLWAFLSALKSIYILHRYGIHIYFWLLIEWDIFGCWRNEIRTFIFYHIE